MKLTLSQAGLACYDTRWSRQKNGDRSLRNFERTLEDTDLDGNTNVQEITPLMLRQAATSLVAGGLSPATANRRIAAVRAALDTAVDAGALLIAPRYKRLPEGEGRQRTLSVVEYHQLVEAIPGKTCKHLTRVLWETGMRVSEALTLRWEDILPAAGEILLRDTKSGKNRRIPFVDGLFEGAIGRRGPFSNISRSTYSRAWLQAKADLGIEDPEYVPHALRHSFATRLVAQGTPINVVSKLMGHGSITMTMRYAHAGDTQLREAVETLNRNNNTL